MTNQPTVSRFVVRKDAQGKWMIWDRSARRPATPLTRGVATTGLSEEEARQILEQLKQSHGDGRCGRIERVRLFRRTRDALG